MTKENDLNKLSKIIGKMYRKPIKYIDDLERWIAYRTYDKYNVVTIPTLSPNYHDKPEIFLHSCFALLTDYVEIELGGRTKSNRNYEKEVEREEKLRENGHKILADLLGFWHDTYFLPRFIRKLFSKTVYTREAGLEYLDNYMKMTPQDPNDPREVESVKHFISIAQETKDLYLWWHDVYLKRQDELDESGVSAFCDIIRKKYGDTWIFVPTSPEKKAYTMVFTGTPEEREELDKLYAKSWALEEERRKEDEQMLLRLVKIRESLWT